MAIPSDRVYSNDHEWAKIEGNEATIGVTDYAQDQLGDIVFVDLPSVGDELTVGDEFGEVESVKSVSELIAPLSGTVTAINDELDASPATVNADPYDAGWMIKMSFDDASQVDALLDATAYEAKL